MALLTVLVDAWNRFARVTMLPSLFSCARAMSRIFNNVFCRNCMVVIVHPWSSLMDRAAIGSNREAPSYKRK
ncbi:MAG TPA: hypothetical protein VKM55_17425 [Candidatus Lokiarchaeia archaeon]|nr:hypothetical protein [Candidatus Lokiarchaeia archaeon]